MHCYHYYLFSHMLFLSVCYSQSVNLTSCINDRNREQLFEVFKSSLSADPGNIYKLRNLLLPSSVATPEIAEIKYQLIFSNNTNICKTSKSAYLWDCQKSDTDTVNISLG